MLMETSIEILATPYSYDKWQFDLAKDIATRVQTMRKSGKLSLEVLGRLRRYFKIKNIYNSNAIEGNSLDIGETKLVVEQGLTITGKPLKDQAEAKNLSEAVDFLEDLAKNPDMPLTEMDIRQIHALVLKEVDDSNAGSYRTVPVAISGSKYSPPSPEALPSKMSEFAKWLRVASVPRSGIGGIDGLINAAAAHTWFVTIHPFIDGNGRVARLLMNLMLMRHGYPIAIISKEDRLRYYDALEESQSTDLTPFITLLCDCLQESLEEYEIAAQEQVELIEWTQSLSTQLEEKQIHRYRNEYEIWKQAMELLRSYFAQVADLLTTPTTRIDVREFGMLEFEKYASLRMGESTKRTWFFRVNFRSDNKVARYLFFFGFPSYSLRREVDVTLFIAREEPAGSFNYVKLDTIELPNVPSYIEVGYKPKEEKFVVRDQSDKNHVAKIDLIARNFFEEVVKMQFAS